MNISPEEIQKVIEFHETYLSNKLECDGATIAISTFLRNHGVEHVVKCGVVKVTAGGRDGVFAPHFWVEIGKKVIDFRLRMWFGNEPDIPHGVFAPGDCGIEYEGEVVELQERSRVAIGFVIGYRG